MAKKILVIPDVHGRTFWKEPVQKYFDQVDRIVFLGDYLDPYREEGVDCSHQGLIDNLMDIINLKREHADKVVLLKGNHDQHYASLTFREFASGSRCDTMNWDTYHALFVGYKKLFKIAHLEKVNGTPYLFSHAGLTVYWLNKVNTNLWNLPDSKVSIADPDIIERINLLDDEAQGQMLLSVVGRYRSWFGEESGSVLWADIEEHSIPDAPKAYGLNQVFQVLNWDKRLLVVLCVVNQL